MSRSTICTALAAFALLLVGSPSPANEGRFRQIGENEATAIGMCHALLAAVTHPGADSEADSLVEMALPNVDAS